MKKMKFYFFKLTLILIGIFILQLIIPGFTELFVLNEKVFQGQVWRYLTAIFLHGDIIHLAYNLFALLFFGIILEKLVGGKRFLITFFVTGIIANIIAVNFYNSSLGASGAIYGVLGAVTIIKPFIMVWAFGLIVPMFLAAIFWIIADILRGLGIFGATNIGSIAHLSGIAIGLILGLLFKINKRKIREKRNTYRIKIPSRDIEFWEDRNIR